MNRIAGRGLAAAAVSAIIFGLGAGAAQANGSYSLDLYISPPFVQGSAISGAIRSRQRSYHVACNADRSARSWLYAMK